MTRISVKVDGATVADDVEPRHAAGAVPARDSSARPAPSSAATPATAAPAPCTSTASSVKSCNVLAVQADGARGHHDRGPGHATASCTRCRQAFRECHGLQCGFCTPGMIMQATDLLSENPHPTEEEIRLGLEGNLCRCTGYHNIVRAVQYAAEQRRRRDAERSARHDRHRGRRDAEPADRDRPRPPPQGGPAADHRPDPLDRQHHAARHAALAMVRSPFAHATITSIDTAAAEAAPNVVAVLTGRDLADEQGGLPNAWPITPDQVTPVHPPMAVDRVDLRRRDRRRRRGAHRCRGPRRRRAGRRRLRGAARGARPQEAATPPRTAARSRTPTSAPTSRPCGSSTRRRPAPAATSTPPSRAARSDGIVIEREYRQQRLIPAFMEPRSVVVDPTGEQITMWSATQIPHILRFAARRRHRRPRVEDPGHRARRRRRFRRQAADDPGGVPRLRCSPDGCGKPVKYTETRSESLMAAHHGRDQWQQLTLAATKDGTVTGLKVELLADLGAYVALVGGGVPVLGAFMFNAIYKFPAYQFSLPDGADQQDLDRRLPRRRPARGDVRHRAAHGRARRRGRRGPARGPGAELDQGTRSSRSPPSPG